MYLARLQNVYGVSAATECFYHVREVYRLRFLDSFFCEHGCCGTTENQRCCSKEEERSTWKVVAIVMASVVGVILLALLCYCLLKKQNDKTLRVRHTDNRTRAPVNIVTFPNTMEIFAMSHPYDKPPPYSPPMYTELPNRSEGQSGFTLGVGLPSVELTETRQSMNSS